MKADKEEIEEATDEEIKSECLRRLAIVANYKACYEQILSNDTVMISKAPEGTLCQPEEDDIERLRRVEAESNGKVYIIVRTFTAKGIVDYFFCVDKNKNTWVARIKDMSVGIIKCWVIDYESEQLKYGSVGFERGSAGGPVVDCDFILLSDIGVRKRHPFRYSRMTEAEINAAFKEDVSEALVRRYGTAVSKNLIISQRLQDEWNEIARHNSILEIAALYDTCRWLKEEKIPYKIKGVPVGGSFILYLLGVTRGNPLPPHIRNTDTGTVHFMPEYADGFDIPSRKLLTGGEWIADGHNIPWQSFFGRKYFGCLLYDAKVVIYVTSLKDEILQTVRNHWIGKYGRKFSASMTDNIYSYVVSDEGNTEISSNFSHAQPERSCRAKALTEYQEIIGDLETEYEIMTDDKHGPDLAGFAMPAVIPAAPESFGELIQLYGLANSRFAYNRASAIMLGNFRMITRLPAFTEDIYAYLLRHGRTTEEAWEQAVSISNSSSHRIEITSEMKNAADAWMINCITSAEYYISKAEAVEEIMFRICNLGKE